MNWQSIRSKVLKALNIAAMDAPLFGIAVLVVAGLYSWAASWSSDKPWADPVIWDSTWRSVLFGDLVGRIFGSITKPPLGRYIPVFLLIGIASVIETLENSRVGLCLFVAVIYRLLAFYENMLAK